MAVRASLLHLYEGRINSSNVNFGGKKVKAFNNEDCACIQFEFHMKGKVLGPKEICELWDQISIF